LTLRQLLWMAEGHGRDEWGRLSALLAWTANCHRDPKKGRVLRPDDCNPYTRGARRQGIAVTTDNIGILKKAFVDQRRS